MTRTPPFWQNPYSAAAESKSWVESEWPRRATGTTSRCCCSHSRPTMTATHPLGGIPWEAAFSFLPRQVEPKPHDLTENVLRILAETARRPHRGAQDHRVACRLRNGPSSRSANEYRGNIVISRGIPRRVLLMRQGNMVGRIHSPVAKAHVAVSLERYANSHLLRTRTSAAIQCPTERSFLPPLLLPPPPSLLLLPYFSSTLRHRALLVLLLYQARLAPTALR
ncbi:hypothetical protein GW17_00037525 [Ensete ventricosum]|nr:hypothetical protein GW17_00037525 [Ensete ventricosum]